VRFDKLNKLKIRTCPYQRCTMQRRMHCTCIACTCVLLCSQTDLRSLHPMQYNEIDTPNDIAIITINRMNAFQFTNAFVTSKFVAIYAQQRNNATFIDFTGIAAGVSLDVYLLTIVICCLLVILFVLIKFVRHWNCLSLVGCCQYAF